MNDKSVVNENIINYLFNDLLYGRNLVYICIAYDLLYYIKLRYNFKPVFVELLLKTIMEKSAGRTFQLHSKITPETN